MIMLDSKAISHCLAIRGKINVDLQMNPPNNIDSTVQIKNDRRLSFEKAYEINNVMVLKMHLYNFEIFICD